MKKITLIVALLIFSLTGYSTTWTITNIGFTFNPASLTINAGDDVNFTIESAHNAVEVSQDTWNANGNTPLSGGFSVAFGGGLVSSAQLTVGTHWYVCSTHVGLGMKGTIIVNNTTGIRDNQAQIDISVYPNPASNFITVKANVDLLNLRYCITDQAGRQVLSGKINSEITLISINQFEKGIYLLQLAGQRRRSFIFIKY